MNDTQTFELCKRLDAIEKRLETIGKCLDTLNKNLVAHYRGERREARTEKKDIAAPMVNGVPIDVFSLEDMVIRVSPTDLKTMLRFEGSRIIEQMRNSERISSEKRKRKVVK